MNLLFGVQHSSTTNDVPDHDESKDEDVNDVLMTQRLLALKGFSMTNALSKASASSVAFTPALDTSKVVPTPRKLTDTYEDQN